MTRKKGKLTKARKSLARENYSEKGGPRCFVINHGEVSSSVKQLVQDIRLVMKPNTANQLYAKRKSKIKDYVSLATSLKVTHLVLLTQTDNGLYLKVSRTPQGPTMSFRVDNYSLLGDVISNQTKHMLDGKYLMHAPCLMTNLQPSEGQQHLQLCSKMFLDLFPTISPAHVKTRQIKRCCLIHYDEELDVFSFRHYAIKMRPQGISKATRKLLGRNVPDLSSCNEFSDFVVKSEVMSESEVEDDSNQVDMCRTKKGNTTNYKSVVKLTEIGPRLTITLVKIEDGLCSGTVLYHKFIVRTAEEKLEIQKRLQEQRELKRKRKTEQEENIKQKKAKKEEHRQRCLKGMGIDASSKWKNQDREDDEDEDDTIYYRQEVGEEPPQDLFATNAFNGKSNFKKFNKKNKKKDT